jgi:hypothetical protein
VHSDDLELSLVRDIDNKNETTGSLDIPLGLGPYSGLSGDTPDVLPVTNCRNFPDGLECPVPYPIESYADSSDSSSRRDKLNSSAFNSAIEFVRDTVRSNNFYTSIGNTILTSSFYSGLALHPLCAALAIFNERRERRREHSVNTKEVEWFSQSVNDTLRSPGIYRLVLGAAFLVNMVEAHAAGNYLFGMIYGFASLGNLGAGRILNQEYYERIRELREPDQNRELRRSDTSWANALTNPGVNWCASDILVGAMTLHAVSTAAQISIGISTGLAALGLAAGIYLGKRADSSSLPLLLNGFCNVGFSVTHLFWGSTTDVLCGIPKIAIATGAWAVASFIIAAKQRARS